MQIKNTSEKFGTVAKTFHWLVALLIIGMLIVGFLMVGMESSPNKFQVYGLHKSIGITILLLAAFRLAWKSINVAPVLPTSMKSWEQFAAQVGHMLLYALMFAMPLSGWLMSSAAGFSVSVFGLFTLPNLIEADRGLFHTLADVHGLIAYAIIALVSGHVLAALLHHFYYKDNVLRRMIPFGKLKE